MKFMPLAALSIGVLVTGCSSQPDCGSSDTESKITESARTNSGFKEQYLASLYFAIEANKADNKNKYKADFEKIQQENENLSKQQGQLFSTCLNEIKKLWPVQQYAPNGMPSNRIPYISDLTKSSYATSVCKGENYSQDYFTPPPDVNNYAQQQLEKLKPILEGLKNNRDAFLAIQNKIDVENANEEEKTLSKAEEDLNKSKLKLKNIVTTMKDKGTENVVCSADLIFDSSILKNIESKITYKVQKTSKGEILPTIINIKYDKLGNR